MNQGEPKSNQAVSRRAGAFGLGAVHRLAIAFLCGAGAFVLLSAGSSVMTRLVASWDVGAIVYLFMAWRLILQCDPGMTQGRSSGQDQSAHAIFLLVVAAATASLVAIGFVSGDIRQMTFWPRALHLVLSIAAMMSSWLLIHTVFAFHYARRYYGARHHARDEPPGLQFPGGLAPDYMDFAYYAFVVGMTSQVSDVVVVSRRMRRLTLIHSIFAFMFNMAILALGINIIASVV